MLPFCSENSGPISITSCSRDKRYQALPTYTHSRAGETWDEAMQIPVGSKLASLINIEHYDFQWKLYFKLHMWQSRVIILSHISIALMCLKCHVAELPLRAGLIRASWMHEYIINLQSAYEPSLVPRPRGLGTRLI